ncbi:ATP-binding protein [Streptomyces sp. AD2-2]|nr:ATP-binding protein [Streptomyces sp. AD2-2]
MSAVAEAVGQAMAAEGTVCVFGDAGRGKTAAVRMALGGVPAGWRVTWVPVPVRPSVAGMRRAVFDALALPGRFPHTSALADAAVAGALGEARVLVVDEARRTDGAWPDETRQAYAEPPETGWVIPVPRSMDRTEALELTSCVVGLAPLTAAARTRVLAYLNALLTSAG